MYAKPARLASLGPLEDSLGPRFALGPLEDSLGPRFALGPLEDSLGPRFALGPLEDSLGPRFALGPPCGLGRSGRAGAAGCKSWRLPWRLWRLGGFLGAGRVDNGRKAQRWRALIRAVRPIGFLLSISAGDAIFAFPVSGLPPLVRSHSKVSPTIGLRS